MRTVIEDRKVETLNVGEVSTFTIKATGKAFKVLIDGLYSDKIRAVIREIWSNAYDAHAAAGIADKPFDCQLPNVFEPVFRVRDYGVGMDHETIMHLYTRVFESSKEDTNEQVGKLGLGSKSPFAYTDTFTVVSFSGTEKRTYSAFIGSNYVPQIALMGAEPCDDARGIEVQFPVKTQDIQAFKEAARYTIYGFDTKPNVTGVDLRVDAVETVMSGNGWKILSGTDYGTRAHAKQGCVIYPIDSGALGNLDEFEYGLLNSTLFIDFPIGDLEIAASREGLGYDETTKQNIRIRLAQVAQEIAEAYQAEIDACPTFAQACVRLRQILGSGLAGGVSSVLREKLTYKGRPLKSRVRLDGLLTMYGDKTYAEGGLRAMEISSATLNKGRHYGRRASIKFEPTKFINTDLCDTVVLFDDGMNSASMAQARIRHWWDNLDHTAGWPKNILWVKGTRNSIAFKRLLALLGRPDEVLELAKFEKPPVDSKHAVRTKTKVKFLVKSSWEDTEVDVEEDIIYVELNRRDTVGPRGLEGVSSSPSEVERVRTSLVELGYISANDVIYGIPQTHKNKIEANEHWVCLWDVMKKAVEEKFDAVRAVQAVSYARKMNEYDELSRFMVALAEDQKFQGFANQNTPASILYGKWVEVVKNAKMGRELELASDLNRILTGNSIFPKEISFTVWEKAFNHTYPLVERSLKDVRFNQKLRSAVIEYVNLIDQRDVMEHSANQDDAAVTEEAA